MNYLIVSGDFVITGGMGRANYALARYLLKQGHQVHLVAHRVADELLREPAIVFHVVPKVLGSYFLSGFLLSFQGERIASSLSRQGPVKVIVNGGNCPWPDVNWVHYVHAAYEPRVKGNFLRILFSRVNRSIFLRMESRAVRKAGVLVANSFLTKKHLVDLLGADPGKVRVVYYGTDAKLFSPAVSEDRTSIRRELGWSPQKPVVMFIGALGDDRKGFDILFSAWKSLCADPHWDADLAIVGSGTQLSFWQEQAGKAGMADRIKFLGFRNDVSRLLKSADCFVAPARYEAYGLGVHEAICCGLPSIVSSGAGIAERYPENLKDFLLRDPDNVEDLVKALRFWRTNAESARGLFLPFSESLRSRSWDKMAGQFLE